MGFPVGPAGKESACSAGDLGSIPGLGRSSGEGNSYPLQYSGPGEFHGLFHGVTKSQTQLSNFHTLTKRTDKERSHAFLKVQCTKDVFVQSLQSEIRIGSL